MELKDLLGVATLLTFLCPGLIFVYVQTVITTGRSPEITKDSIAAFVAVSAIYTVAVATTGLLPAALQPRGPDLNSVSYAERLEVSTFAFVVPALLGFAYAAAKQRNLTYHLTRKLGLKPVHPSPTAWGTAVRRLVQGDYVIATLKDGKTISGNLDHLACFSSKEDCTDMVLSETSPPEGQRDDVTRLTWIASGEVQTLEIVTRRNVPDLSGNPNRLPLFFRRYPPNSERIET